MILRDMDRGVTITQYCWAQTRQNVTRVVSNALDGTVYMQVIGRPTVDIEAEIILDTAQKPALELAEAEASIMSLTGDGEALYGRITSLSFDTRIRGGMQRATLILAREEVG